MNIDGNICCSRLRVGSVDEWVENLDKFLLCGSDFVTDYSIDDTIYYFDRTDSKYVVRTKRQEYTWTGPIVGFRDKFRIKGTMKVVSGRDDMEYLREVLGAIKTNEDARAVMNHRGLLRLGCTGIGDKIACIDLEGIPKSTLTGFFLCISQKRYSDAVIVPVKVPVPVVLSPVLAPIDQFRRKVVELVVSIESGKKLQHVPAGEPSTYEHRLTSEMYIRETAIKHLNDAVEIVSNIECDKIIIPGDGIGVFTQVARIMGKDVVSGDSSSHMVDIACGLGITNYKQEHGIDTIERAVNEFNSRVQSDEDSESAGDVKDTPSYEVVVFLSFLWKLAPDILLYCRANCLPYIVYDTSSYYPGSSEMVDLGNNILKCTKGVRWAHRRVKLREMKYVYDHKPMIDKIGSGVIYFDSVKGLRQVFPYTEINPGLVRVSRKSLQSGDDPGSDDGRLVEMSKIHKFELVDCVPDVRFLRIPHNVGPGLNYDIDTWKLFDGLIDIADNIVGNVRIDYVQELYGSLVGAGMRKAGGGGRTKHLVSRKKAYVDGRYYLPRPGKRYFQNSKYYIMAAAQMIPVPKILWTNGKLSLVWLVADHYGYDYVHDDGGSGLIVSFVLNMGSVSGR